MMDSAGWFTGILIYCDYGTGYHQILSKLVSPVYCE